jgi:hypothetical protein
LEARHLQAVPACSDGKGATVVLQVDGDDVLDQVENSFYDDLYEDAFEGWCRSLPDGAKQDLGRRLTDVFHAWLIEHDQETEFEVIEPSSLKKGLADV